MPVSGPWVAVWKRRLAAAVATYNLAHPKDPIVVPTKFDPNTWYWGVHAQRLAAAYKTRAGIAEADGRLDGALRKLIQNAAPKPYTPKIIDVRNGGNGFPTPRRWGKRPTVGLYLVGHYTGGLATFQQDARYHQDGQGWAYLSYHLGVDVDGNVLVINRPDDWTWHARGLNWRGVGLSFVGNEAGPNAAQRKALEWLIPRLLDGSFGYGFPALNVMTTHRHAAAIDPGYATSCPGDNGEEFYRRVAGKAFRPDPRPFV